MDKGKSDDGGTALLLAAQEGCGIRLYLHFLSFFSFFGVSPSPSQLLPTSFSTIADVWFPMTPHRPLESFQRHGKLIHILVEHGGAVDRATTDDGTTPLIMASWKGHLEVVRALCDCGATVNTPEKEDLSPLHMASQEGFLEIVKELLSRGADPQRTCKSGITPIFVAAEVGQADVVDMLCNANADVNAYDNEHGGGTPLFVAVRTRACVRICVCVHTCIHAYAHGSAAMALLSFLLSRVTHEYVCV